MVLHEDGIVVATLEADVAQEMGELVATLVELAIGNGLARSRHDDRGLIGTSFRLQARIHAFLPLLFPRMFVLVGPSEA